MLPKRLNNFNFFHLHFCFRRIDYCLTCYFVSEWVNFYFSLQHVGRMVCICNIICVHVCICVVCQYIYCKGKILNVRSCQRRRHFIFVFLLLCGEGLINFLVSVQNCWLAWLSLREWDGINIWAPFILVKFSSSLFLSKVLKYKKEENKNKNENKKENTNQRKKDSSVRTTLQSIRL